MNRERLKSLCKSVGIDVFGVTDAGRSEELKDILMHREINSLNTGLEEKDIEKRIDPKIIMEDAKSIIVCAFPYYTGKDEDSNISNYCYGLDYHIVAKKMMKKLCEVISLEINDFKYEIFADNGPLVDRYLAYKSAVGYYGLNNCIINDKYGSYIFIGYIINNFSFDVDKPLEKSCIKCGKCKKYCPGNVISGNYEMNPTKCLSHITQKKGELSTEEIEILKKSNKVFGCDVCQEVCPHNANIEETNIEEFKQNLIKKLNYSDLQKISNREFKRVYGNRAFSWRGKGVIIRNMEILMKK